MPVIVISLSNINLVNACFYWLFHTTQIWVVLLLIGHTVRKICFNQSEALPRSELWHIINMEFLGSFLRHHFVGKPVSGFFSGYKYICCVCYPALTGTACTQQFFSVFTFFVREEVKEMMNKRKTGSETLAAFEEHLNEVTFSNLRKQATFHNTFNSSPGKWHPGLEFLCLFLRRHFMGKLLVALQNVGCFFFFSDRLLVATGL